MKILIVVCLIASAHTALAQTNADQWVFQWGGQPRGILFGGTNLTESQKCAVRDDINCVMSNVAVSNTELFVFSPGHPHYGQADGLMSIPLKGKICPSAFPLAYYKMTNGMFSFILGNTECSVYTEAIALTNSFFAQISSLPATLIPFTNGFNFASMTVSQKRSTIWNPTIQQRLGNDDQAFVELFDSSMPNAPELLRFFPLSVLSFKMQTLEEGGDALLTCTVLGESFFEGNRKAESSFFVYVNGGWKFCPPIF